MKKRGKLLLIALLFLFIAVVTTNCGGGGGGIPTYTAGGTVSGLTGTMILQNNGGDDLAITSNGAFTFSTAVADGSGYSVTVKTQPAGQTCFVTNGSGTVSGADVTDVAVGCYNSGSLDPTLNNSGIVVHDNAAGGNDWDEGYSITTDSNGKILVTGGSYNGSDSDMVIWRYNADGTLDTTFDSNGVVVSDNAAGGNGWDEGVSITTDANGKILVTGYSDNGSGNADMVIWRYNANGTPDTTFDSNGIVVSNNAAGGNGNDDGNFITTDANGKILVTGYSYNGSNYDMVIWRYNANGAPDTTFDSNGIVVSNSAAGGNGKDIGRSITTDATGKILVTGFSYNSSGNYDMVIWRYNADGTPDTTFDSNGIVVSNNAAGGNDWDEGYSITTDANGKILVTGNSYNGTNYDMVIWRYNANGAPDTTFDSNGIVVSNSAAGGNGRDEGYSITTDSNGKVLVTGNSNNGSNYDMVIWRYNANGAPDTTFDTDGIVVSNSAAGGNSHDIGRSIITDADGKVLVTGSSLNGTDYDMVIWRYIP